MRKVSTAEISERQARAEAEREEANAMQALRETDWYVIRNTETGAAIPVEVSEQRSKARIAVDAARAIPRTETINGQ